MTIEQTLILAVLAAALAIFIWDRWRYDVVALVSLMVCVLLGLVEPGNAFSGFSNPAVITVVAVLVISHAIIKSGAVDFVAERLTGRLQSRLAHLAAFCSLGAVLSAFMNNVAALALLMPIALSAARRFHYAPALLLLPLSYSTLLGGMITLIGTPPNLLIAGFRAQATGSPFQLFDFAPTGLALAIAGVAFIVLVGWRLIPKARLAPSGDALEFDVGEYVTEARVPRGSKLVGQPTAAILAGSPAKLLGVIREERRLFGRLDRETFETGDILLLQADTAALERLVRETGLELVERERPDAPGDNPELALAEAVVLPNAIVQGSDPLSLDLGERWGIRLVAASRQGRRFEGRLRNAALSAGDVLLLEGTPQRIQQALAELGCLPLARRRLALEPRRVALPAALFGLAIAATATGIVPPAIALSCAAIALVAIGLMRPAEAYESIDWPVVVLLGAMIPVGDALETTGAARLIGDAILVLAGKVEPVALLAVVLITTMLVTPVLNNAATVVIMAPIVISMASQLAISPDAFLMAVAIGASCDFLTPFGHHNNTLIMGPGRYRFGDYWRVGLPLDVIVVGVSLVVIPLVWPLRG